MLHITFPSILNYMLGQNLYIIYTFGVFDINK